MTPAERQRIRELARWLKPRYAETDEWYIIADGTIRLLEALEAAERERDKYKAWYEGLDSENGLLYGAREAELALLRPIAEAAKRAVERYDRADTAQKGQGFVRAGIAEAMVDDLRAALAQAHPQDPEAP